MRLRDKVSMAKRPVVVYEILPPRIVDGTIESYAEKISTLLSQTHIDAINIPEVRAEETRGTRPVEERLRAEPREFGRLLQDSVGIEAIVNRVTVHDPIKEQQDWLVSTYESFGIENIVVVGGESGGIDYPGPGVIESASLIREINDDLGVEIFCGGICLPSRKVESARMLRKTRGGVEFFTTQVLYDGDDICKMLGHYHQACLEANEEPKRVLLSFAPISTERNIEFLKWLGVEIPRETEEYLVENLNDIASRSMEVSMRVLEKILGHVKEKNIAVPIGLNIEHIMTYNFDISVELLQLMAKRYRMFCMRTELYD